MDTEYLKMKLDIVTYFEYPPIPIRDFDWCAHFDDYEPGQPVGQGPTEAAAVEDLILCVGDWS